MLQGGLEDVERRTKERSKHLITQDTDASIFVKLVCCTKEFRRGMRNRV